MRETIAIRRERFSVSATMKHARLQARDEETSA